jgi:hypothetical protein
MEEVWDKVYIILHNSVFISVIPDSPRCQCTTSKKSKLMWPHQQTGEPIFYGNRWSEDNYVQIQIQDW